MIKKLNASKDVTKKVDKPKRPTLQSIDAKITIIGENIKAARVSLEMLETIVSQQNSLQRSLERICRENHQLNSIIDEALKKNEESFIAKILFCWVFSDKHTDRQIGS